MTRRFPPTNHTQDNTPILSKVYRVCLNKPYIWMVVDCRWERGKWYPVNKPDWLDKYFLWNNTNEVVWYQEV